MSGINPFSAVWLIFACVWLIAALRTKRTQERAPFGTRMQYAVPILAGSYLMFTSDPALERLHSRIVPRSSAIEWLGLALTVAGIALAIWARFYIGQNWSSAVTVKVGHELIRSGPYGWVRHPIYSGILLALIGTALARGKVDGMVAIPLFYIGFWIKSRMEEEFMRKTFGEQYVEYSQTTGALVPKFF
jgi:protein-S-isoprenylcysteine O-methyltransferase Ste14